MSTDTKLLIDAIHHIDLAIIKLQLISEHILVDTKGKYANAKIYNVIRQSARQLDKVGFRLETKKVREKLL